MKTTKTCCGGLEKWLSPKLFKSLGDPNRVSILTRLADCSREMTVTEIAKCCPVNFSVVSRHLKTLREAGILDAKKRGREVFYRVRIKEVAGLLRNLADALDACCPDGVCTAGEKNARGK